MEIISTIDQALEACICGSLARIYIKFRLLKP